MLFQVMQQQMDTFELDRQFSSVSFYSPEGDRYYLSLRIHSFFLTLLQFHYLALPLVLYFQKIDLML